MTLSISASVVRFWLLAVRFSRHQSFSFSAHIIGVLNSHFTLGWTALRTVDMTGTRWLRLRSARAAGEMTTESLLQNTISDIFHS